MKESNLLRLLRLAQKTGDTLIVSPEEGNPVVVMPVDKYEMLLSLPAEEGRQISTQPKSEAVSERYTAPEPIEEPVNERVEVPIAQNEVQGEEKFYLEPVE